MNSASVKGVKLAIVLVCLVVIGCAENGGSICVDTIATSTRSSEQEELVPQSNALSYIQGPDDNSTIPVVHVVLVSSMSEPHIWVISEPGPNDPTTMRLVARDTPGHHLLLNRANNTSIAAFDGTDSGWITLQRYDDGGGENWNAVGWFGAVTIPGDP